MIESEAETILEEEELDVLVGRKAVEVEAAPTPQEPVQLDAASLPSLRVRLVVQLEALLAQRVAADRVALRELLSEQFAFDSDGTLDLVVDWCQKETDHEFQRSVALRLAHALDTFVDGRWRQKRRKPSVHPQTSKIVRMVAASEERSEL